MSRSQARTREDGTIFQMRVGVNTAQVIVWDRGRPRPQRAAGAKSFGSYVPNHFRASRSFAGGTPAVPDNHLVAPGSDGKLA